MTNNSSSTVDDELVASSIEELRYIAGHENTTLVVAQACNRAADRITDLQARLSELKSAAPAIEQLRDYQEQLDADGVMVGVSRQAIDETLAAISKALSDSTEGEPK